MTRQMSNVVNAAANLASRRFGMAALVLSALALGGCPPATTKFEMTQFGGSYQAAQFEFIAGGRDFHTVVVGSPVGGDDAAFADRVTTILRARSTRQRSNFTTEPGCSAKLQFRMVMVFNPARRVPPNILCSQTDAQAVAPQGTPTIVVDAAYCNGEQAVTSVRGSVAAGDDAALEQFLAQLLQLLFPQAAFRQLPRRPGTFIVHHNFGEHPRFD